MLAIDFFVIFIVDVFNIANLMPIVRNKEEIIAGSLESQLSHLLIGLTVSVGTVGPSDASCSVLHDQYIFFCALRHEHVEYCQFCFVITAHIRSMMRR